jgi:hypothetical protein
MHEPSDRNRTLILARDILNRLSERIPRSLLRG